MHRPWRRLQRVGAIALLAGSALFLGLRCAESPHTIFLFQGPRGPWIMAPDEVTGTPQLPGNGPPPATVFRRRFDADAPAGPVRVHTRALRSLALRVNGKPVSGLETAPENWKRESVVDVTSLLVPGSNEIAASVRNPRGPALLALWVEGLSEPLGTDASWSAAHEGEAPRAAIPADDTRPHPSAAAGPAAWDAVLANGPLLLGLFIASAWGCWAWQLYAGPRVKRALPLLALGASLLLFAVSVLATYARIYVRSGFGFDLGNHLAYVEFVRKHHALPLATDGWSSYHPPLFYVASAALADAFAAWLPHVDEWSALRVLPFASGLVTIVVAWELARSLVKEDPRVAALAALFAAGVPLNLTMTVYPSNEAPHAALLGLALLFTVRALLRERTHPATLFGLGALFGLALLTKFTALVVVPVAFFFVACKLWILERMGMVRLLGRLALFALALLGVCGWWYARNVVHFGRPIVGNWDLPDGALVWWQQPGFHTAAYYLHFGTALERPLFSGFRSFWDALYSTFWSDGWLGGRATVFLSQPTFAYGKLAALALLGLPATALLVVGALRLLGAALRGPDAHRSAALSFLLVSVWALGLSMLYVTLELPFFGQAKSSYGLSLLAPLALFFAVGLAPPRGGAWPGGPAGACVVAGYLGALFFPGWIALWG